MTKKTGETKVEGVEKEIKKRTSLEAEKVKLPDEAPEIKEMQGEVYPAVEPEVQDQPKELSAQRIYVGPGKPGLITNTLFAGDYPLPVREMIAECPAIERLMVKIEDYQKAQKRVNEQGTLENANAKKVLEYFRKGVDK